MTQLALVGQPPPDGMLTPEIKFASAAPSIPIRSIIMTENNINLIIKDNSLIFNKVICPVLIKTEEVSILILHYNDL